MTTLSILIAARNEMFLARTVADLLEHCEADTNLIVVVDGAAAGPPVEPHPRVQVTVLPQSIGQRAALNLAARLSDAEYLMKVDAHCAFAPGFDCALLADMQPDWTLVPLMRNLHAFDWVCPNGHRRYQGPSGPCQACGEPTTMDVVWIAKPSPRSTSYCFDAEPHFQYFGEYRKRPEAQSDLTETMSLQGSAFMLSRRKWWELEVCDEAFGSWGSQGIEVAVKTWLSGGRVMCSHKTWYAHMFRTQGGDFGFPYPLSGRQVESAKRQARDLFFNNRWPQQARPLSWLVEKFWPVPGWTEADLARLRSRAAGTAVELPSAPGGSSGLPQPAPSLVRSRPAGPSKGIVHYTDNGLSDAIAAPVRAQIAASGLPVVSVSLAPLDFGHNLVLPLKRGYLTLFRQILAGLEASPAEVVFFCEHDVLYDLSHFDFTPQEPGKVYYNTNVWHVRLEDGHALYFRAKRLSQLCAYRQVLLEHYRARVARVERDGFSMRIGFEPGTHRRPERIDDLTSGEFVSARPNLDIKHGHNLTPARWRQDQFRDQRNCQDWQEAETVPGWDYPPGRFADWLSQMALPVTT